MTLTWEIAGFLPGRVESVPTGRAFQHVLAPGNRTRVRLERGGYPVAGARLACDGAVAVAGGRVLFKGEDLVGAGEERLRALREHALIESAVSSNRIEGVEVDAKRVGTLVFGRAALRDRDVLRDELRVALGDRAQHQGSRGVDRSGVHRDDPARPGIKAGQGE